MVVADSQSGSNILSEILEWSSELPGWQQDALRRIVERGDLAEDDLSDLTVLCKHAHGVAQEESVPNLRPLGAEHIPQGSVGGQAVTLRSIANVRNVNALSSDPELTFGKTGLTVIFGYNASGKSGYGQILRRSCRARRKGSAIKPNVFSSGEEEAANAEIVYALDGEEQSPEQWIDGQRPIEELGAVSFFDSDCATVHVQERNEIAFTPFGLDVLPKLGVACKEEVQKRLDTERKRLEAIRPRFLDSAPAREATTVGKTLSSLDHDTNVESIEKLASLSDQERQRLQSLSAQLANDPKKQAEELRTRARRIAALKKTIMEASAALSDDAIERLKTLAKDCAAKTEAADATAKTKFSNDPLPEIGEQAWRELWAAARRYSSVCYPDRHFPVVDDDARCVLCQQPLEDEAKARLERFEEFVADDTAKQAAAAKESLKNGIDSLDALGLRNEALREQIADVQLSDSTIAEKVRSSIAALLLRLRAVKRAYSMGNWDFAAAGLSDVSEDLDRLTKRLKEQAEETEKATEQEERQRLESELSELKDREWLGTVLGDVKEHLYRLSEIEKLNLCISETRTNKITAKSKALAKKHVTDQLRSAFASELRNMHQGVRRLNVELTAAAGEYGSSYYRVQLVGATDTAVESIVSEGEHQCIALAGFLSELATERSRSAIVFDDPVTSLDHIWRECFAKRLVEEANKRQVIVFTHDVVFLHDLLDGAKTDDVPIQLRRVLAEREHTGIVSEELPWIAQKTTERIDALEKKGRSIQGLYDDHKDDEYEKAVGSLYSDLRATVERTVEEWVFRRVVMRHRDYVDLKGLKRVTALTIDHCERLQKLHQKCCDITEAHDRAALRGFGVPHPEDAQNDIAELRAIVDDLRDSQKAV